MQLNRAFRKLPIRLVVVIDDLDRMDGAEIAFVFKIIRLCANFDNVVYLVAFDRAFVEDQLERQFGSKGKAYFDKIVQLELPLPKVEPVVLERIFSKYLNYADKQLGLSLMQDEEFLDRLSGVLNPHILQSLNSVRLVKRLINRFLLAVPLVEGEVNYFDLLVLEVIWLRWTSIYEKIFRNPERFSYQNSVNWAFPVNRGENEADAFYEDMVGSLESDDREAVLSLLGAVFNSVRLWHTRQAVVYDSRHDNIYRERRSAAHPDYFPRYFYYGVQHGVIPDTHWDAHIQRINTVSEDNLSQLIDQKVMESISDGSIGTWLGKMRLSSRRIELRRIPILLSALSKISVEFSTTKETWVSSSDYRLLLFLMVDLLERLGPKDMEDTLLRLIDSCPDLELLRDLLQNFALERGETQDAEFDIDQLKKKAGERLRQTYIDSGTNILLEPHQFGGLLAIKDWLEPSEYKPYIQKLLEEDRLNATRILGALTTHGQQFSMDGASTYRVLEYAIIKSLTDPKELLRAAKDLATDPRLSEDQVWAINTLQIAINDEAEGQKVDRVSELDLQRREYEQQT